MRKLIIGILFLLLPIICFGQLVKTSMTYAQPVAAAGFCAEYQAIYDVMTTPPGRDGADTAMLQNTMVKALVDGGYWTNRIDLFYVTATRTRVDAYRNWAIVGSYDLTDPGGTNPTFTPYGGIDGNTSTMYLSTNYVPATNKTNISLLSTTIAAYLTQDAQGVYTSVGVESGTGMIFIRPRLSGNASAMVNTNSSVAAAVAASTGFFVATRRGETDVELYRNGTSIATSTDRETAVPITHPIYLLASNDDGTSDDHSPVAISVVILMNGVTTVDQAAINIIIEAYMGAIGKGVE